MSHFSCLTSKPVYISTSQYPCVVRWRIDAFLAQDYVLGISLLDLANKNRRHQLNIVWSISMLRKCHWSGICLEPSILYFIWQLYLGGPLWECVLSSLVFLCPHQSHEALGSMCTLEPQLRAREQESHSGSFWCLLWPPLMFVNSGLWEMSPCKSYPTGSGRLVNVG